MRVIDLNADLGEGAGDEIDNSLLEGVTSANLACGGHAGDDESMRRAIASTMSHGVRIGAHPSYPDRDNFGRARILISPGNLIGSVVRQVSALIEIAETAGAAVEYIKPHGALYNDAARGGQVADSVIAAAERLALPLMVLGGSPLATRLGDGAIAEGFIDRGYTPEGYLRRRGEPGAVITDPVEAAEQAVAIASRVRSLCVHSDTPRAPLILRAARAALVEAGFEISAR